MKKILVLAAAAFIMNYSTVAQKPEDIQKKNLTQEMSETRKSTDNEPIMTHTRKNEKIHMPDCSSEHGKNVSSLAKSTEPGKGKGDIISKEARMQGKARRLIAHQHASPGNHFGKIATGARGNSFQHRNIKMYKGAVRK